MREQLNDNPMAQVGLVVILVIAAALMFVRMNGGEEEESGSAGTTEATVSVEGTEQSGTATGATPGEAVEGAVESALEATPPTAAGVTGGVPTPPLPAPVRNAYKSGDTVVLLFVHDGGINDKMVERATAGLEGDSGVSLFTIPSRQIARYAAATVGLEVNRVPALVVVRPRGTGGAPEATVDYGYQTPEGVRQAVDDASYEGRELPYHPR